LLGTTLIIKATAVRPEGRITPECIGLWQDSQIEPIRRIADFIHSQGQKLGIQLAHARRKASTVAPWLVPKRGASILATEDVGGWPGNVKRSSAITWGEGYAEPKEMTRDDIRDVVEGFRNAGERAVKAGVDVIEIHAAHGYLLCSFLSPISNRRTDEFGGSFENRARVVN
jgi:2,4-dienoyl-CoA reductase-like NADH-dependent reductase (Old Yellow Enzyme family)